ncbi:MAG: ATP-binding protein [Myxococcota bacterium]
MWFAIVTGVLGVLLISDSPTAAVAFLGMMAAGIVLRLLAPRLPDHVTAHLTSGLLLGVITGLGALNGGGLGSPGLFALPLVPVLAFFLGGQRIGIVWFIVTALVPLVLFFADPWLPPAQLADDAFTRWHLLSTLFAIICLGMFAWQYDQDVGVVMKELGDARGAAEQANRSKDIFLATISHEIRTPLAGVLGAAELLGDATDATERDQLIGLLRNSGQGLHALVDQVLDLSRLEAGEVQLEHIALPIHDLVQDAVSLHHPAAARVGITLRVDPPEASPHWVYGDPLRLRQIVQNLISNSIKFTKHGEVVVHIQVSEDRCTIVVKDTGIGISESVLQSIFQPFRQADEGTARAFGGSGLGLSIVHELVTLMDGHISVSSELGVGSTFTVCLPLPLAPAPKGPVRNPTDHPLDLHVLLADDNPFNRSIMERVLRRLGCSSRVVSSGREAVDAALSGTFHVVLMDVHMPEIDGIQAARQILAATQVPILALTASITSDVEQACTDAGMVGFISKPVSVADLKTKLRNHARLGGVRPSA